MRKRRKRYRHPCTCAVNKSECLEHYEQYLNRAMRIPVYVAAATSILIVGGSWLLEQLGLVG